MSRFLPNLIIILVLGMGIVWVGAPEAEAQSRSQQSPAQQGEAPGQGQAPTGIQGPPATRPSNPPSSLGQSPGGKPRIGGQATTNDAPGTPGDPDQVPLGGAEWLAAAGAAYALNRLRKGESEDAEDKDE